MRCKYINTIDINWALFFKNQEHAGFETIRKGISLVRNKRERFFCSCGESGTEFRDSCPKCGAPFMKFDDDGWRNTNHELGGVYKDIDQIKFSFFDFITSYVDDATVKIICSENVKAIYDLKSCDFTELKLENRYNCRISKTAIKAIETYFPDFFASPFCEQKDCKDRLTNMELSNWVSRIVAFTLLPNTFNNENYKEYPKTTDMLLNYAINTGVGATSTIPLVDDLKTMCIDLGFPEELFPIIEEVVSTDLSTPWTMDRLKAAKLSDFFKTNIGALMFSRLKHGTMGIMKCVTIATNYSSQNWNEETENLFLSFCKECMDMYSPDNLIGEFNNRMSVLRSMGVFIDADSLRSRNYFRLYNLANFRKTLKNTDIEELIQKDPLKLISRIR